MVTFVDDVGAVVPLPGDVLRIVSLVPSLTEALALSCREKLVGATDWCTHPADLVVARVRGTKNPDLAAIMMPAGGDPAAGGKRPCERCCAPCSPPDCWPRALSADCPAQPEGRASDGKDCRVEDQRSGRSVRPGHQAPPRNGVDRAPMTLPPERERPVDHCQTGPDQEHVGIGRDCPDGLRIPGVSQVGGLVTQRSGLERGVACGQVAEGQDQPAGADMVTRGQSDRDARAVDLDGLRRIDDPVQVNALGRRPLGFGQDRTQVGPVPDPGDEAMRSELAELGFERPEPALEVVDPLGEGTHLVGRHVQDVGAQRGRIGEALAQDRAALDEADPEGTRCLAQEVDGDHGAAEPAADDGDGPGSCGAQALSPRSASHSS